MIIVDTSIWIEFFKANPKIFPVLKFEIDHQNVLAVECVFAELLQGVKNFKGRDLIFDYWKNLPKKEERGVWIEAGILSSEQKFFSKGIGVVDAFLVALARKNQLKVWSLDKKLNSVLHSKELFSI